LPNVNFSEQGDIRFMHLGTEWVQGSMWIDRPYELELEYVQRMMAWLLLMEDLSQVPQLHAMQLGLGAASLTKFCRKKLQMHTTAIEINPQVISACRFWFKLPPDDAKLQVVLADAGEAVRRPEWVGRVTALQVDLYDHEAAAPVLDSEAFYADCRALLTEGGCMTVNLFGQANQYPESVALIAAAFGHDAVWMFKPTKDGNTIVLAQATPSRPSREQLEARATEIQTRWGLPAAKWLKVFKPLGF
jgi:spermidine synthase